jgi:TnpA family transposase
MPRQVLLSLAQRTQILVYPSDRQELVDRYSLNQNELDLIAKHRGDQNRLGFAVQLCCLRRHGRAWDPEETIPLSLLKVIANQIEVDPAQIAEYAKRDETRREHFSELLVVFDWRTFGLREYRELSAWLKDVARTTDQGIALVRALLVELQERRIVMPSITLLDRLASSVRVRARRDAYHALTVDLSTTQRKGLDDLLSQRPDSWQTSIGWLRQPSGAASAGNILKCIERLVFLRKLGIPSEWARRVHQNRLLQVAREGLNTDAAHLREFIDLRRHGTLVAMVLEAMATLTDQTLEMHERFLGKEFRKAERKHVEKFHESGKAINEKVNLYVRIGRALIEAKATASDAFKAIESVLSWDTFQVSVEEAAKLAQPDDFDFLALVGNSYPQLRRYAPEFLDTFEFRAAPASEAILKAVELLRDLNAKGLRKVPSNAPRSFIRRRWEPHVFQADEIDRRFYELCVLSELRNALRSGDLWVVGSRQFRDFEEYLLPPSDFSAIRSVGLPLPIKSDCTVYLKERSEELQQLLIHVNGLAERGELPDAVITDGVLKITPLNNLVPEEAGALIRQAYAALPRTKITDLLVEVDEWTGFSEHFVHLRSGAPPKDRLTILTAILADAINLGLVRMADACPGSSLSRLSDVADWNIRDETYSKALAEIVNFHHVLPFSAHWGDGTTSSSDGQYFRAGGRGEGAALVNARYGNDPGVLFYTHISDQYAPFHTKVINATVRDATHVLDGLLYHESDLLIEEHYTDTAGFTDHVFALCHLLGFRFAPRIRDLADKRLYTIEKSSNYPTLTSLISAPINIKQITTNWNEILRLATSIKQGTVTASLMLRKLGAYPRQNGLAVALRELGRMERTIFTLEWLKDVDLRRRVHVGLNKGEAKNALSRAVFFNRLGELRDRSYENQRHRASGLNLVVAAIVLWNTIYLERSTTALRSNGHKIPDELIAHLSPLGWEHINLTGDYLWKKLEGGTTKGRLRPLRAVRIQLQPVP